MSGSETARREYTRAEYVSDVAVHLLGLLAVAACVPTLVVLATYAEAGYAPILGVALYGACFAAMITCSALYNIFPHPDWEWLLKRLDHSAIYLKIAGTVTGFALIAGHGAALVVALWTAASVGISLKMAAPFRFRWLGIGLYLGMGWAAVFLGWGLFAALPGATLALIASGGIIYTVGVGFYLWERLPFHFTIWHGHVLVASLLQYAALVVAVTSA